ncbi:SDR family NAD(P)-dependent oxidoreductase [Salibacterium halotolerans]|uniref:SDR family NAD(P)-dependent oxidoreductase n=1 Tax=Salibacterium halotolerans TaxID=1884432 RepID=UPI001480DE2D|nr:SDR family oxidoreductase [Salibacterium halotolerans]
MHTRPKTIMITGASSGIGKELAVRAAGKGHHPLLISRSREKLELLKESLHQEGKKCSIYTADVTDEASCKETAAAIMSEVDQLDVVINNAGTGVFSAVEDIRTEEAAAMLNVNVFAPFFMTKQVLPVMKEQRHGIIINIGSQAGKIATPKASFYAASKHAIIGFSNALRQEVRDSGIYVSVVNTGPVRTPFIQKADRSGQYEKSAGPWMLPADKVAERVLKLTIRPRRELNMPWWMDIVSRLYRIWPGLIEKAGKRWFQKK